MGRRGFTYALVAMGVVLALGWASPAMAAYNHLNDKDSSVFRGRYPGTVGTKLDSCALCHTGGSTVSGGKTVNYGSCQWCHTKYGYDASGNIKLTLNAYGSLYSLTGRNTTALSWIESLDPDHDGFSNAVEIAAGRFPGDPTDDPSKKPASFRVYSLSQLKAMTAKTQVLAMNASKSDDSYSEYTGVTVEDLLDAAGVLPSATGIKVYAPDGFSVYHPLDPPTSTVTGLYPVRWTYPEGTFYYDAVADMATNPSGGWINYSSPALSGLSSGSPIAVPGGLKLLLAYARDGAPMTRGKLTASNKLDGEGPYRLIPPQVVPGPLDQRSSNTSATLIWPYDNALDHNAGFSSRSATIIKVEPLPEGTTDVNVFEAGWDLLDQDKVVVYGALESMPTAITLNRSASAIWYRKSVVLSGSLTPAVVGDNAVLEVRKPGSKTWTRTATRPVGSISAITNSGSWSYKLTPKLRGLYSFRVRFAGDVARDSSVSPAVTVRVK